MSESERERTQRRVYVLPSELVERITEFQTEMGLPSEVEAARRLLDEALKQRDDALAIARRFRSKLAETRIFADIARDVLVGHPRVSSITFQPNSIQFSTNDGEEVTIKADGSGSVQATNRYGGNTTLNSFAEEKRIGKELDDEIPF